MEGFVTTDIRLSEWEPEERRLMMINAATKVVGLGPGSQTYRNLCWPHDTQSRQQIMESSQSACALVGGGLLRLLGLRDPLIDTPYFGRSDAVARLEIIARKHNAWEGPDVMPLLGDLVIVGTDVPKTDPKRMEKLSKWGSPGHVSVIIDSEVSLGNVVLHSVDGGRKNITEGKYIVIRKSGAIWLKSWTTRRIYGVVRVGKLTFVEPVMLPQ